MFDSWKIDSQGAAGFSRNRYLLAGLGLLALLVLGVAALIAPTTAGAQGQSGTTLSATKTATAHYTKTFDWTIDKSVSPDKWDLFKGDSGTSDYEVKVTKDDGTVEAWVDGQICVTNGGAVATQNLAIVDNLTMPPSDTVINSVNVNLSSNPVLDPGESQCYNYRVDIPEDDIVAGATYKDTADVTITNHAGHPGTPFGPNPSATSALPSTPTLINDTINVDDTNGGSWQFSDDGSQTYDKKFTCDADEGTHNNTATIRETDQSDSASVTVNCYEPLVTKDAKTSLDRTFDWSILKTGDQSSLTLSTGQTFDVNYSVVVDVTGSTDSNHHVSGKITVDNTGNPAAKITGVSDTISGFGAATVDCGNTVFPYTIPAGGKLECTYSANLPNADSRTNTATATLQNYDYDSENTGTESGTTDFTGTASVGFSNATVNEIDECVNVSDTYAGSSVTGEVCRGAAPKTFTYKRTIGPYATCGQYTVNNTASFTTNDRSRTGSDGHTVAVNVPCGGGCTLTQGYWKTHSREGPARYDDTWALLGAGQEDTMFFLSGKSYYEVLWTPPAGNAYYVLASQYIAAKLNQLNGANVPANVQTALNSATTLFNTYTPAQVAALKGNSSVRAQFVNLATTLDNYNNGVVGPGHCSEQNSA